MSSDTNSGATILQYILFTYLVLIIAMASYIFFSDVTQSFGKSKTIENCLCDIGGAVSTDVMETVIFLPSGGNISYKMEYLPMDIAGEPYSVELNISTFTKEHIDVLSGEYCVRYVAGGIKWEINGSIKGSRILSVRR